MTRPTPPDWALPGWDSTSEERSRRLGPTAPGTFGLRILAVSDVTRAVREAVRGDERLRDLWVEGEVGRVTISSAGHAYFALKDERNQLQCVWFRDERLRSAFEPQAGLRIVVHGRIDLFEPQGALQLYVESIQPAGFGDLALRFEALKARLAAEGLFDAARKRPLPQRPATIGVVTSPTGVVWRDICHVLARRWPLAAVVLVAAQVQGEGAPASIVTALRRIERYRDQCRATGRAHDAPAVTILARGGGSLEDLWPFNDERVVRAVVASTVPVVCGVGHEADVTLADFAADVRAPTPSAAAEIVVPDRAEFAGALRRAGGRLSVASERRLAAAARDLAAERRALDRANPIARLATAREQAGLLFDRLTRAILERLGHDRRRLERAADALPRLAAARLSAARAGLDAAAGALAVLGPQATLDRGYAIVRRTADGGIVRDPAEAPPGTHLALRVARGEVLATTDADRPPKRAPRK
ncbi:MAG TPA: exodeoxyribonuclease VII large subunit [Candidatus Limnocylindrales bacterium]|jgi:exodeoxyribonuclease VII large subunit|nr:exodeoxyribonuclease VII large subunit [Candidatus Limnocylindrales bacterium]